MSRKIPIVFHHLPMALNVQQTADVLNVSRRTVWRLKASGKLRETSYGRIPVVEIERHLREEISQ